MLFKLGFLAVTHLFLTALAEDKNCYKGGVKVSTLGDDIDLRDAFNSICDRIGGKVYQLGQKVSDCENVGGHRVDVSIIVKKDSDAEGNLVILLKPDCSDYFSYVTECKYGGYLNVEVTGGHHATAAVRVDPQWAQCN